MYYKTNMARTFDLAFKNFPLVHKWSQWYPQLPYLFYLFIYFSFFFIPEHVYHDLVLLSIAVDINV